MQNTSFQRFCGKILLENICINQPSQSLVVYVFLRSNQRKTLLASGVCDTVWSFFRKWACYSYTAKILQKVVFRLKIASKYTINRIPILYAMNASSISFFLNAGCKWQLLLAKKVLQQFDLQNASTNSKDNKVMYIFQHIFCYVIAKIVYFTEIAIEG